jgi:hypothetical protein
VPERTKLVTFAPVSLADPMLQGHTRGRNAYLSARLISHGQVKIRELKLRTADNAV